MLLSFTAVGDKDDLSLKHVNIVFPVLNVEIKLYEDINKTENYYFLEQTFPVTTFLLNSRTASGVVLLQRLLHCCIVGG